MDYETDSLSTNDGEAYRLSGRGLDLIGRARLHIETPWEEVNKELIVSTLFADDIVTRWTPSQSRIMFEKLVKNNSQEDIGNILGVSRQMVSKTLKYLKRILILTFIFTGNIEGVGFLLAAKSVFRFGELNRAKDIKTTEYVLIGTFTSFTIAIMLGFGVDWLMKLNFE